ncbi:hypothetical protein DERP_011482 [Dermatophagoides pteronyssinus]|uniref:Uncharacterized protein n=1 Tax=Dermatophagoides pteronyssinus TaxID=6956 RepID=A0ABQ8J5D9_DERPT|nr:hypothetical protein DERP_011482 [Dermatophagoides pteronyssinus]
MKKESNSSDVNLITLSRQHHPTAAEHQHHQYGTMASVSTEPCTSSLPIYLDNDYTRVPVPLICNDNGGGGGRLYSTDRPKTSKLTIHMKND